MNSFGCGNYFLDLVLTASLQQLIYFHSVSAINVTANSCNHTWNKHVGRDRHLIQTEITKVSIATKYVFTIFQLIDIVVKTFGQNEFEVFSGCLLSPHTNFREVIRRGPFLLLLLLSYYIVCMTTIHTNFREVIRHGIFCYIVIRLLHCMYDNYCIKHCLCSLSF